MRIKVIFIIVHSLFFANILFSQNLMLKLGVGAIGYQLSYSDQLRLNSNRIQSITSSTLSQRFYLFGKLESKSFGLEPGVSLGPSVLSSKPLHVNPQLFFYSKFDLFSKNEHNILLGFVYENIKSLDVIASIYRDNIVVNNHGGGVGVGYDCRRLNFTLKYIRYWNGNYQLVREYRRPNNALLVYLGISLWERDLKKE